MMRALTTVVVLCAAVVGCQSSPLVPRTFAPEDIAALLLQPSEPPSGTAYSAEESGPAILGRVAQGDGELVVGWRDLGFVGGHVALFISDAEPPADTFVLIGNAGLVFPNPVAASQALELHRSVGVPHLTAGAEEVPVDGIGDEAFAVTFRSGPVGMAGAISAFRVSNVMFLVAGSGQSVTADDLVAIARTIAGRAQR